MSGDGVKVEGAQTLARTLRRASRSLDDMTPAQTAAGRIVVGAARAPVRTGRLATSTRSRATRSSTVIGSGLRYAPYVHWGARARHIEPRPYLSEAATSTEATWLHGFEAQTEKAIAQVRGAR